MDYRNYNSNQSIRKFNIKNFINQHRLFTFGIFTFGLILIIVVVSLIMMASTPSEPQFEPEDPPYLTLENNSLIENPFLGNILTFHLSLILLDPDEINTAPLNTDKNRVVVFEPTSYQAQKPSTVESIYSVNINISDGRKYILHTLVNVTYDNEYAVAILDRLDQDDAKDYIITFTSNTSAYYTSLGTNKKPGNASQITDYITDDPLDPLPESGMEWIKSFTLTNPQTRHSTLPSIR